MRCFLRCLGNNHKLKKKSREKRITIPSKHQSRGVHSETIQLITSTNVEVERTKEPIRDPKEKQEEHLKGRTRQKVPFDFTDKIKETKNCSMQYENERVQEKQQTQENGTQSHQDQSDSSMSSVFTYPPNNRFKNCRSTDHDSELDDHHGYQQESSESLFSLSIDSIKQSETGEKEVNSPMKICDSPEKKMKIIELYRSGKKDSVPNPIENPTQLNPGKLRKFIPMDDQEKEETTDLEKKVSIPFGSEDPSLKQRSTISNPENEMKSTGLNQSQSAKTNSVPNPIDNLQLNPTKLRKCLVDDQEEKENINSERKVNIPFGSEDPIFKQRSIFPKPEKEMKISGLNQSAKTYSVLNPIENHTQWKVGKSRKFISMDDLEEKECAYSDPNFKQKSNFTKPKVDEIAVDTSSLSSWLVQSKDTDSPTSVGNSSMRENSFRRFENDDDDRQIVRALSFEDLKQISASSSPRRLATSSPDEKEKANTGTVGSFWDHTGGDHVLRFTQQRG